jgi:hypothetical protein
MKTPDSDSPREGSGAQTERRSERDSPSHDRMGDLSMSLAKTALRNPAITIAIGTVVLFAIARIPAEIFYSRLGLRPEDAGLNSVQILLQGVTTALVVSLAVAVLYGVVFQLIDAVYVRFIRRLGRRIVGTIDRPPANRAERFSLQALQRLLGKEAEEDSPVWRAVLRRSPLVVTSFGLLIASVILTASAIDDADAIKNGEAPPGGPSPWRARQVTVLWTDSAPQIRLPDCRALYYLGEGNGRVALFDSRTESAYRLSAESIQLSFPEHCG